MSLSQPGAGSMIKPGFTASVIFGIKLLHSHDSTGQRCSNRTCEDLIGVIKESDSPCGNNIKESWHTDQNKAGSTGRQLGMANNLNFSLLTEMQTLK